MGDMLPQQKNGLFLTVLYALLVIVLVFLIGFDYKLIDYRWTSQGPFRHLAALSVACVVVIFVSVLISFVAFIRPSRIMLLIFLIYQGLSMCLSFATSVVTFMGSAPGSIDDYIGCRSPLKGLVELWGSIDHYLIAADQLLCSKSCTCLIPDQVKAMMEKRTFFDYLQRNNIINIDVNGKKNIQGCTDASKKTLTDHFTGIDSKQYNVLVDGFDNEAFMKYWANMEKQFNCTGWCTTSYTYDTQLWAITSTPGLIIPQQGLMTKFLFTNNDNSPPQNIGCMGPFIKFVKRTVKTYSSCLIIACFFQIITFFLGIQLIKGGGKSKDIIEDSEKPKEVQFDDHNDPNKADNDNEQNRA